VARLVAAAVLLAAALPVAGSAPVLDGLRGKARAALDRGDGIAAEVPLREAVRNGTPADAVRDLVGEALLLEGDRTEARRWLTEGAFAPDTAGNGWRVRGRLELAEGNLQRAAQAFDQALRFSPMMPDCGSISPGCAFRAASRPRRSGRRITPCGWTRTTCARWNCAGCWCANSMAARRAAVVRGRPADRPNDKALLGEYAATLGDLGQYRAMLAVCRKLIEVDPKNARALYLQAVLAARAGKTELARSILLRTGSALRDMPAAIQLNGILEYRAGNVNLAVEYFDRLSRMQPDNLEAQKMLARALDRQGDYRQILDRFEIVARQPWASPYMLALVGHAWERQGKPQRAAPYLARAAQHGVRPFAPPVGRTAGRAGRALQRSAEFRDQRAALCPGAARNAAQRRGAGGRHAPARRQSGASEAHLLVGDVRMLAGDTTGAIADYDRAASIRYTEPVLVRWMRRCARRGGRAMPTA
jgi:tetratricopeptide (TPR) repeat protein